MTRAALVIAALIGASCGIGISSDPLRADSASDATTMSSENRDAGADDRAGDDGALDRLALGDGNGQDRDDDDGDGNTDGNTDGDGAGDDHGERPEAGLMEAGGQQGTSPDVPADRRDAGSGPARIVLAGGADWSGIHVATSNGDGSFQVASPDLPDFASRAGSPNGKVVAGDFDGDGVWDLAMVGGVDRTGNAWTGIPVAVGQPDGAVRLQTFSADAFQAYAAQVGAKPLAGDFDGDGVSDIALVGGVQPNGDPWDSIVVAFSRGNGVFDVKNSYVPGFPELATQGEPQPVAGDFNRDGRTDIALVGGVIPNAGTPWSSIPVAFSSGDGTFIVTNLGVDRFPTLSTERGARPVAGDFDGDGRTDIALVGGRSSDGQPRPSVPVAFSYGDGEFWLSNEPLPDFAQLAVQAGAQPIGADFDGDGRGDIALVGGVSAEHEPWTSIPIAFSQGNGVFRVTNLPVAAFGAWAAESGAQAVASR